MTQKIDSISRFSPGNCTPELLESMLVGQHQLVDRLEKTVLDDIQTDAGHHWLLVGPRGAGKTHLLAILFNRIDGNEAIRERVAIAYMKEEERGVASFLDWLVRILRAFERQGESAAPLEDDLVLKAELTRLTQIPLDQAQTEAERLLLRFVGNRRLLLIVENLGELFSETKGMAREGQRKFRDLIQQHPFWMIMGSTQALFEDIQTQQAPFYGFFKVHHLDMFSFDQAVELLGKLAALEGREQLKTFFQSAVGQGRIRAIHEITGGNPRLLVIFYQFVDRESIEDLSSSFLEMVDNLTAYYQEQMAPLPALQQKIVEFLCERRSPQTVKEIAQSCFVSHQTAAGQLKRLGNRRLVRATRVGRESYYELREPLFRICFEVKENMGYPIRLFIDFLGKFYSVDELKRKYKSTDLLLSIYQAQDVAPEVNKFRTERTYIEQAAFAHHQTAFEEVKSGELEERENIAAAIDDLIFHADYREAVRVAEAALDQGLGDEESLLLKGAIGYRKLGEKQAALERLERLIKIAPENAAAWVEKASIEWESHDWNAAEVSYRRALEIDEANVEALMGLGAIYGNKGNDNEALNYFHRATQSAPQESKAWELLGMAQELTGDVARAGHSFRQATDLNPKDASAWLFRGRLEWRQANHETALDCLKRSESLAQPVPHFYNNLGECLRAMGRYAEAIIRYQKAIALDSGVCVAHFNIALALFQSGDLDGGMRQLEGAVESGQSQDWDELIALSVGEINVHLLSHAPERRLSDLIERQRELFENGGFSGQFAEGLIGALTELLKEHRDIPLDRLLQLREGVIPQLSRDEQFSVVCRLFDTGVRFLQTQDMRVLLELPLEERATLQKLLGGE